MHGRRSRTKIIGLAGAVLLLGGLLPAAWAQPSTALCGVDDTPEPGIQGEPAPAAGYNCGLSLVSEIDLSGAAQGTTDQDSDHCAYVRSGGGIHVFNVNDPENPVETAVLPTFLGSETLQAITTEDRALLLSGAGLYDIGDCDQPVVLGQINWIQHSPTLCCPHDVRLNHIGTKAYASFGLVEADISNLDDPDTWTVENYTCDIYAQHHPVHEAFAQVTGTNLLCDSNVLKGQQSHNPDTNDTGSRLYMAGQVIIANGANPGDGRTIDIAGLEVETPEEDTLRVVDLTTDPPTLLDQIPASPGHSVDWFRITETGREYVLHANEIGVGNTCVPHPRSSGLGWAFEAFITEVTGDTLERTSMVELAINKPEFCQESNQHPAISQALIDNPKDATFATINWGNAGLRMFDIRNPENPSEVAYFNRGTLVHSGLSHYDASRGLLYLPTSDRFRIVEIQPQVLDALGLPHPPPPYPRYPTGRAATP